MTGKGGIFELIHHSGACMCGRFGFRLLAPADLKALDCPGPVRYPHVFVPASAFQPLQDLRLLTLYTARGLLGGHVVVHAFCTACGVPIFRASDGAIDTLVVNVECLHGASIRSVEVTYYEDLLGFPRGSREAAGATAAGDDPCRARAWERGKAAGPEDVSEGSRPKSHGGSSKVAAEGALVKKGWGQGVGVGSGTTWGGRVSGLVENALPFRNVFGGSGSSLGGKVRDGRGYHSSASVQTTGATSLLSHLLSRASLSMRPAPGGLLSIEAGGSAAEEEGLAESGSPAGSQETSPVMPTEGSADNMWLAWDESCEIRRDRGETDGVGRRGWGQPPPRRVTSSTRMLMSGVSELTVPLPGQSDAASQRVIGPAPGWERLGDGCTPPSMHQLRYHLKRHLKRRLNWLSSNGGGETGLGRGDLEEREDFGETRAYPGDQHFFQHHEHEPAPFIEEEETNHSAYGLKSRQVEGLPSKHQRRMTTPTPPPSPSVRSSFASTPATPLADATHKHSANTSISSSPHSQQIFPSPQSEEARTKKGGLCETPPNGIRKKSKQARGGRENRATVPKGTKAD